MRAIILAGGKGTRLRPYTYSLPKPLMPIGGEMPILEIILQQLKRRGFNHITLAINYMAKIFQAFFGDGTDWNIKIDYYLEKMPLGTVGPLTLIEDLPENFLVMNGDLLTDLDFKNFFNWHIENKNDLSVATYRREYQHDSGILKYDDSQNIYEFEEKPKVYNDVSMGIYMVNRKILEPIPKNKYYGFDKLIISCINNKYRLKAYPHDLFWLDIGRDEDYKKANDYYVKNRKKLLNL